MIIRDKTEFEVAVCDGRDITGFVKRMFIKSRKNPLLAIPIDVEFSKDGKYWFWRVVDRDTWLSSFSGTQTTAIRLAAQKLLEEYERAHDYGI